MSTVEGHSGQAASIVERAKNILLQPSLEWDKIALEPTSARSVFTGYVMILAAIPALASLIGTQLFGIGALFVSIKPSLVSSIVIAILTYAGSLLTTWILGLIIDFLATNFQGEKNPTNAYKVAACSGTAGWLAGVFSLVPALGILGLLGLYSIYLLYRGLPRLMKSPAEKATGYTAAVVVVAIIVNVILFAIITPVAGVVGGAGLGAGLAAATASVGKPSEVTINGQTLNVDKMEEAAKKMEAAAEKLQNGEAVQAVDPNALEGLLPLMIAAAPRGDVSSSSNAAGGYSGSSAETTYSVGGGTVNLKVTDIGALGAMASIGTAMNVNSTQKTGNAYEKITTKDGRMVTESYDSDTRRGKYAVMVKDRILIEAEGDNVDINTLKSAVAAVDASKAETLVN